jgi:hypothetical protein
MAAYYRTAHEIDDDVVTDIAPDLLRDVILPSNLLSSDECSDEYRRMYALRVEQTIATDHADLRRALGEGRFVALVRNFLATETSAIDAERAAHRFGEFLRAEAERDPALWIARSVALRRLGALRRSGASRPHPGSAFSHAARTGPARVALRTSALIRRRAS